QLLRVVALRGDERDEPPAIALERAEPPRELPAEQIGIEERDVAAPGCNRRLELRPRGQREDRVLLAARTVDDVEQRLVRRQDIDRGAVGREQILERRRRQRA